MADLSTPTGRARERLEQKGAFLSSGGLILVAKNNNKRHGGAGVLSNFSGEK